MTILGHADERQTHSGGLLLISAIGAAVSIAGIYLSLFVRQTEDAMPIFALGFLALSVCAVEYRPRSPAWWMSLLIPAALFYWAINSFP